MWEIITTYTPLLKQTSLPMEETSVITVQQGGFAMGSLQRTTQVLLKILLNETPFSHPHYHVFACLIFILFTAAENLGFTSYPPAYLNLEVKGKNLLNGANFASAASGYYDPTAKLYVNIHLPV